MKYFFYSLIFFSSFLFTNKLTAQSANDTIANGMAFKLGSKLTLKLVKNIQNSFDYKVIKYSEFTEQFKIFETEKLFEKNPEKETIEVIFGIGYYKEGKDEKDFQTVMLSKNNYSFPLQFDAEIKVWNKEEFEATSVTPLNPGTRHTELWPYKIDYIALINFRNYTSK
ncbi:hypothetical protein NZ698_12340 [Chryseobacterium sp. PBS4-4]|uniref:Uncharacterized protein n=1 Tax=Chryseobacterium edaphi TaxID=2976532 RepID=A0ABT2WBH2_9FLAO|nr:hypothetical protein [Chryseobacterium edaphi]MCU7617990.1 hypothetical protein [Chryseobacterium edaphi]